MPGGNYAPGDNGGPVTSNGLLVGLLFRGIDLDLWNLPFPSGWRTNSVKFGAILDDVNSTGGPGAGFTPVPA